MTNEVAYCIVPVAHWGQDLRVGGFLVGVDGQAM